MYLWIKYIHIFTAIVFLGTSAGLGILLEFFAKDPLHGNFLLTAIRKVERFFVIPGYLFMFISGFYMFHESWSLENHWIPLSMILWLCGFVFLLLTDFTLGKQILYFNGKSNAQKSYKYFSILSRLLGAAAGLIVAVILYFMVFKPD